MEPQNLLQFPQSNLLTTLKMKLNLITSYIVTKLSIIRLINSILSLYFYYHNLIPCKIDLTDRTTMHFWTTKHRHFHKPNLVLVHGYGGDSKWQFFLQIKSLSKNFNIFIPDLLFFGDSYSKTHHRSYAFQAECVRDGLRKLGVEKYNVYGLSYGGYVVYQMAERWSEEVEKVVILSCGIKYTEEKKEKKMVELKVSPAEYLVAEKPKYLKMLLDICCFSRLANSCKWVPDFLYQDFINVMHEKHKQERIELVEYLMKKEANANAPVLTQETLLIWGDQDNVFPRYLAYDLQSHLGSKARLEIIKDCGHAANIDAPQQVNQLIESFVLGSSSEH